MGSLCLGPVVQCFEKWSSCGRRKAFTLDHLNEIAWLTVDPWQKPSMSHRSTPRFVRRGVGLARQLAVFVSSRQTIPLGSLAQSPMWKKKRTDPITVKNSGGDKTVTPVHIWWSETMFTVSSGSTSLPYMAEMYTSQQLLNSPHCGSFTCLNAYLAMHNMWEVPKM